MGRVKELIIELAETFEDLRPSRGTWHAAIDAMKEILSPDEFEFFLDHIDDVKTIIGMHNDAYPTNEARGGEKEMVEFIVEFITELAEQGYDEDDIEASLEDNLPADAWHFYKENAKLVWDEVTDEIGPLSEAHGGKQLWLKIPEYDADDFAEVLDDNGITHESEYLDSIYGGDYSTYFFFNSEEDFRKAKIMKREFLKESLSEARGDDDYDQYELGPGDGAITNLVKRDEIEWPVENRDEEDWDEDDDIPYPGGLTQDDYDLDYDKDPDEDEMTDYMKRRMGDYSYEDEFEETGETDYMRRRANEDKTVNEDWTFIQEVALITLIPLVGALAINYIKSRDKEGAEELKAGWRDWITDIRRKVSPKYDKKMAKKEYLAELKATRENVKKAIEEFGEGKLTIEEVEKIVKEDPKVAEAVRSMMTDPKLGYLKLYNALKNALGVTGVKGTPIPDIKDRFVGQAKEYQANKKQLRDAAKDALQQFANNELDVQTLKETLFKLPEGEEMVKLIEEFASGKYYNRDNFYALLTKLFRVRLAKDTPGPKIIRRFKKEETGAGRNQMDAGDPEAFNKKHANESLLMPSLNEYWDDDDDDEDMWVTINGKRVHKNSREYRKWYEEEGEFDDTEGRSYRRNRYGY